MFVLDLGREKPDAETRFYECHWARILMRRANHEHLFRPAGHPSFFGGGDLRRIARRARYWGMKWVREKFATGNGGGR